MENIQTEDKGIRVLRLLKLISKTDDIIKMNKQAGDSSSIKGNQHLKYKLVTELQSLLKEHYNLVFKLDEAA